MTDRQITHAPGCWDWGPRHYGCAVREIERLRKLHQDAYQRGFQEGSRGLREAYDAIQEVKRQDAWGNAQLTEALMAAEERAERAEAENKRLRKDAERFRWLTEDHADVETRTRCREILDRMAVMSYSAACVAIDHARRAEGDGE